MSVNHLLAAGLVLTLVALGAGACGEEPARAPESSREPALEGYDALYEPSMPEEPRRVDGESTRTDEEVDNSRTRVTRVIDGDTVETAKLGRVRLIGVDAPDEWRCYGTAATRFTRQRLEGQVVRYELGEDRKDRYGGTLAYLWRGDRMHNLALVQDGYAEVLTIPPNDRYADLFEAAERWARRLDEGGWGACERRNTPSPRPPRRPETGRGDIPSGGVPPPPPDLDCADLSGTVRVGRSDPHRLDADGDGVGCNE
ncbi:MAG: thermonuclease family protein [Actinomycetota bacterium]|nr:thermonuclease family protein [Actinomycetota bacterium]